MQRSVSLSVGWTVKCSKEACLCLHHAPSTPLAGRRCKGRAACLSRHPSWLSATLLAAVCNGSLHPLQRQTRISVQPKQPIWLYDRPSWQRRSYTHTRERKRERGKGKGEGQRYTVVSFTYFAGKPSCAKCVWGHWDKQSFTGEAESREKYWAILGAVADNIIFFFWRERR